MAAPIELLPRLLASRTKLVSLLLLIVGPVLGENTLANQVRKDRYGDPLPPGALARMGTIRLRHGGHVMSVAFTPDGKSVVSGGFDGWAFLWDVRTGKRLRAFRQAAIQSVAIDPDGKRLALASWLDGTVKLYELATGKELADCPGHRNGTWVVAFSPDGKRLASGGKDKRIRVWDAATLKEVRSWQASRGEVFRLRFTPDGKSLVSAGERETLRFWDAATGAERPRRIAFANPDIPSYGCSFCFSADGKTLLTGSNTAPGLLQLWDLASGKEIRTLARTQGGIGQLALAPDGKSVWTAAWGDGLRHRDLATGKELLHLPDPFNAIEDLAVSPDGKRLAAATRDYDDIVFLWDTTTGRKTPDFVAHRSLTTTSAFTPDGQHLWTGGFDGTIRFWSVDSGKQLRCFARGGDESEGVDSLALRPDGKMLAAAVARKVTSPGEFHYAIRLWDLTSGEEQEPLRGHDDRVTAVAFSPDGRLLASRGDDHTIRLWDNATGKQRLLLRCQKAGAKWIAFSLDGRRVIGSLDKETIGFWDTKTGRLTRKLSVGPSGGSDVPLLSRDGRTLITGGGERPLRVWEVASGKERCRIERPDAKAYVTVALSPDSRMLACFDYGQPIKLWDLLSGNPLGELGQKPEMADVLSLMFSPDGRRLCSTHSNGTALIWDAARLLPKAVAAEMISDRCLQQLWSELGSVDAEKGYRALRSLVAVPGQSVPLLCERLPKAARSDTAKIHRLLAELDSEEFKRRERAARELQELGMSAEGAIRRALRKQSSLEVRRRLEQIAEKLESRQPSADELRTLRAIEILEMLDTPPSRQLLDELARGSSDDWLTLEAKAALERLSQRSADAP